MSDHVMPIFLIILVAVWIPCSVSAVVANANQSSSCTVSCEVAPNVQTYGFDANKQLVMVDMRKCVKVYLNPSGSSCVAQESEQSCQKQCSPRSFQLDSYSNRTGPFVVKTIKKCHANTHHCQTCQRKHNRVFIFPASKYQQKIDVGKCSGVCSGDQGSAASDETTPSSLTCQQTRTRTLSVEGPNGHVTVEVIENCSCVSEQCYRADHFQSVSVRNLDNRRQEELVNTGKCTGTCQGVLLNARCLQYDSRAERCIWYLPSTQGKCRPTQGSIFSYSDLSGANKTLPVVEECGCTTG